MTSLSTQNITMIIAMVVAYIMVTSVASIRLRNRTSERFIVTGRLMSAMVMTVLLMSGYIDAKSTIGALQEAFSVGIAASWSVISAVIGFLLFGLFMAKRLYVSGQLTTSGFIVKKYGNSAKLVVSAIMTYALFLVSVDDYVSGTTAIFIIMHVDLPTTVPITTTVSTIYFIWGGPKSVAYLTIVHSTVKVVGIGVIVVVAWKLSGGIAPMAQVMPEHCFTWKGALPGSAIGTWIIDSIGTIFSTRFIIQTISSTKSPEAAHSVSLIAAVLCTPISIALGFIGAVAEYLYPNIKSLYAPSVFLQHMHPLLVGVVTTSLVTSILVNACTVTFTIVPLIVTNFYMPRYHPSAEQEMRMTHRTSLAVDMLPLVFMLFMPQILVLSSFTRALWLSMSIVVLIGIHLSFFNNNHGAISGLILAVITATIWYLLSNPFGADNMYITLVTSVLVLVVGKLFFRAAEPAQASTLVVDIKLSSATR